MNAFRNNANRYVCVCMRLGRGQFFGVVKVIGLRMGNGYAIYYADVRYRWRARIQWEPAHRKSFKHTIELAGIKVAMVPVSWRIRFCTAIHLPSFVCIFVYSWDGTD